VARRFIIEPRGVAPAWLKLTQIGRVLKNGSGTVCVLVNSLIWKSVMAAPSTLIPLKAGMMSGC